jgi:hypothetical protein
MGWLIAVGLLIGAYFLFKDTMNRLQYVQWLRLYWITRNNAPKGTFIISPAFMRQTAEPWWRGRGIQFRAGKYTFQIGVLTSRGDDLISQVDGRDLEVTPSVIREWK